jgi:hypothetical protein
MLKSATALLNMYLLNLLVYYRHDSIRNHALLQHALVTLLRTVAKSAIELALTHLSVPRSRYEHVSTMEIYY